MKKRVLLTTLFLLTAIAAMGCTRRQNQNQNINDVYTGDNESTKDGIKGRKEGEIDLTEEEMYKILEETGYGDDIDWANQSDDDPTIAKYMDVTRSKEEIAKTFAHLYGTETEPGDNEKAWWDYIPDDYDLSADVFAPTENYAGHEKTYNNSLMQNVVGDDGLTSGQSYDMTLVEDVAKSYIYESVKDRFKWTNDLKKACDIADSLDVADFYSREGMRPIWQPLAEEWNDPAAMTAYYNQRILSYDRMGIPTFGPYEFNICVWSTDGKLQGWVNELEGGKFINEDEVYENMAEWDFYDNVAIVDPGDKVVKPKLPNGAMILKGQMNLSKEQYIHKTLDPKKESGMIYYYANGIVVDLSYYGGKSGGSFKEGLEICRAICQVK